jgi:hypothetical protein
VRGGSGSEVVKKSQGIERPKRRKKWRKAEVMWYTAENQVRAVSTAMKFCRPAWRESLFVSFENRERWAG